MIAIHDINQAARFCDRVILLSHGRVVASGTRDEALDPELLSAVFGVRVRRATISSTDELVFTTGLAS